MTATMDEEQAKAVSISRTATTPAPTTGEAATAILTIADSTRHAALTDVEPSVTVCGTSPISVTSIFPSSTTTSTTTLSTTTATMDGHSTGSMAETTLISSSSTSVATREGLSEKVALLAEMRSDNLKGIIAALIYVVCSVATNSASYLLDGEIPILQLNAFQNVLPFLVSAFGVIYVRKWPVLNADETKWLAAFLLASFTSHFLVFMAFFYQGVALAETVYTSVNLLSGVLVFRLFMREKVTLSVVIPVLLCLVGVTLVLQPDAIFASSKDDVKLNETLDSIDLIDWDINTTQSWDYDYTIPNYDSLKFDSIGYFTSILAGIFLTVFIVVLKKLSLVACNILNTIFWCLLTQTIISMIVMASLTTPVITTDGLHIAYVTIHCVCYAICWPAYMLAIWWLSGNTLNILTSTATILMLLPQYTVISWALPPSGNVLEGIGVLLVLAGVGLRSVEDLFCLRIKEPIKSLA